MVNKLALLRSLPVKCLSTTDQTAGPLSEALYLQLFTLKVLNLQKMQMILFLLFIQNLPYKAIIPGGFYPGKVVTVQGFVQHDADRCVSILSVSLLQFLLNQHKMISRFSRRFHINLRFNSGVAFHFNPRFNENVVVRNSYMKEQWGCEERGGGLPLYTGQMFTVTRRLIHSTIIQ